MSKKFIKPTDDYAPDAPPEVLNKSIDDLNLYAETKEKLKSAELNTLGEIARCEMRQLYKIDKMNKRDVFAVLRILKSAKLDFRQVEKSIQSDRSAQGDRISGAQSNADNKNKSDRSIQSRDKSVKTDRSGERNNSAQKTQEQKQKQRQEKLLKPNSDKPVTIPANIERQKVNTRDYDSRGNKRRERDSDDHADKAKKTNVINLPPLKLEDGLYKFYKSGKWGYKDEHGKIIIQPTFDEAYNFSEGMAGVEIGEKVGFIDKNGEFVIPAIYDSVTSFKEGLASVTLNEKCAYIDKEGKEVFGFDYEAATCFTDNVALVKKDGKWGYMDRFTGEIRLR